MTTKKPKPGTIAHELGLAKDEPTAHLQVPLPRSVKERFAAECEREGETMSTITRRLIVRFLGGVAVLLFAVVGSGCFSPIPVHHIGPDEHKDAIEEAGAVLGYPIEWRDSDYGAIRIDTSDEALERLEERGREMEMSLRGWAYETRPCRRRIDAKPLPGTLAHEIGHVFGLRHADHGVMQTPTSEDSEDWYLSEADAAWLDDQAALFYGCNVEGL